MSERKVLLHVGAPKTGTSFVQDLLFRNREQLAAQGVLYPAERFDAHFLAALDLMQLRWGGLEEQAVGAWDRLADQVRDWQGTVIVSHEILAAASPEHVARAMASLGDDSEVHVVASVRDLVRQVPAEWQENVKHRRTIGYREFLDAIMAPEPSGRIPTWFWSVQDVPAILDRWGAGLPPEQVHVVTVPPRGAPRDLLWERFASVFGLDPAAYDLEQVDRANPSLGVAESALVRSLNERVNGVLPNELYREMVREVLAHRTLSRRSHSPGAVRLRLPDDVRRWAEERCEAWIEELGKRRYDVVGALEDLRPAPPDDEAFVDPDDADPARVADAALDGLEALVLHAGELRSEVTGLHEHVRRVEEERDRAVAEAGLVFRAKRRFVLKADTSPTAHALLSVYRRVRRR
jgi:hypothetical protein